MMNNITTTTNTINKNTPSLRERTHELAKAQKKAKDCEAYILITIISVASTRCVLYAHRILILIAQNMID